MSDQFIGEIRAFGFQFSPAEWAYCFGQQLSLYQYQALYSILGTNFGPSDHKTYFTAPDLRGRAVIHTNTTGASGLASYTLAQTSGTVSVAITGSQMPAHTHQASAPQVGTSVGNTPSALAYPSVPRIPVGTGNVTYDAWTTTTPTTNLAPNVLAYAGGTPAGAGPAAAHSNISPYLTFNFCIALIGSYPVRN